MISCKVTGANQANWRVKLDDGWVRGLGLQRSVGKPVEVGLASSQRPHERYTYYAKLRANGQGFWVGIPRWLGWGEGLENGDMVAIEIWSLKSGRES